MTRRNLLLTLLALLLLVPVAIFAQDGDADDDLPECPAFEGESSDVRVGYYMGEAIAFSRSGQTRSAELSYTCIVEVIDTGYLPAYVGRVNIYTRNRQYDLAIEDLTTVIDLNASAFTTTAAYNNRGIIYALEREYELAVADFESALSLNADFVPALNNRAIIHIINGEYDQAIAIFEGVLANSNVDAALEIIRDPEDASELPEFSRGEAQAYAMIGLVRSAQALDNYDNYLTAARGGADSRIQSAAGALESRFTFELRVDDGSYFINAPLLEPVEDDEAE
jgi:tetratricopeptide (TPR) repeat protein